MKNTVFGFSSFILLMCTATVSQGQETMSPAQVFAAMRAQAVEATKPRDLKARPKLTSRKLTKWPMKGMKLIPWHDKAFHVSGVFRKAGNKYPQYFFGVGNSVSYSAKRRISNAISASTCTNATQIEIFQKGTGFNSHLTVFVNKKQINKKLIQHPSNGALYSTLVDFGTSAMRCYRFLFNNPHFGGILLKPGIVARPPKRKHRIRVIIIGDSFTESSQHWAVEASRLLGWDDAWLSGVGGTGYISAPKLKLNFGQRLESDVIAHKPNVIVIAGGINDSRYPLKRIKKAAANLFSKIQKRLPNTIVFVLGPWNPRTAIKPGANTAIKQAAVGRPNFHWVPNYDDRWITGTGRAGAPKGDGNSDTVIGKDGVHPTVQGHQYLARKFAGHIRKKLGVIAK